MSIQYTISSRFANTNGIPTCFVGEKVIETPKALYVYGHGMTHPESRCIRCGRTLTHPGSILIGIGPECLQDWGARDVRLDNLSPADIERLKKMTTDRVVDGWIPKAIIKTQTMVEEIVVVPENHPKKKKTTPEGAPKAQPEGARKPAGAPPVQPAKPVKLAQGMLKADGDVYIRLIFPYSPELINNVKTLPGRKYHAGADKFWTCPVSPKTLQLLVEWGFQLSEGLQKLNTPPLPPRIIKDVPGLKKKLFPYQMEGVSFLEQRNGRGLIADEMGLGKTAQALAWLQLHPELRPAVVVVPASLKLNWEKEADMWMDNPATQILSGNKTDAPIIGDIIIINYDILPSWVDVLKKIEPKVLVTDECHYFKNNGALRTKAVKKLGKTIPHVIALSGTPIISRPIEAYNAIKLINPDGTPSVWEYGKKYCALSHNRFGWDFNGACNTEDLHKWLSETIMIRRIKAEVLTELPDKLYSVVPLEMTNSKNYAYAESNFISWIRQNKGDAAARKAANAEALVEIETLKQVCVAEKMNAAISWIRNFLEVDSNKLVVFATHKTTVDRLMEEFAGIAVKLDGSTKPTERQSVVERFQSDPVVKLFVGNIRAAGVGITLTAASNVAFLELPWTPGELSQAEDRCHRIGQKDTVNVYYLLATGTIEEMMAALLDSKRKIVDSITDGIEASPDNLLTELLKNYTGEDE